MQMKSENNRKSFEWAQSIGCAKGNLLGETSLKKRKSQA
jgi:hypothetical protein